MPSLRQLMYFACVAEYGSIGQAAEVLHVSQPSLSRQIQALEAHIGEALFVRGPAGVSLTEVGRVVHCRAVKIIAEAKALTRDIGDGDDRQLHIGFSRYLDPGWSGELARQLKEARVCSAVSPSWAPSLDLLSLVRESSLDAAIIGRAAEGGARIRADGDRQLRARHRPVGNPAPATGARLVAERPDWRAAAGTEGLAVSRLQPVHERCDGCRRLRAPAQRAAERPEHSPGPGRQRRRLRLPAVVADQVRLSGGGLHRSAGGGQRRLPPAGGAGGVADFAASCQRHPVRMLRRDRAAGRRRLRDAAGSAGRARGFRGSSCTRPGRGAAAR
ncbi:transcriptional regulator [Pseudomonas aeruginosa VRFPA02]|nr:transcriptional regulator [Pseudomonas aeruginosa VRFPA02]